ncbi:hypothetical protein GGH93_000758 [Coemansia aciculifera]|nr:hypothetical protein GGH93_000758 [Coemansia aciculifera]
MSDTSDFSGQFTRAFIGIHDKTPDMRIIYVTSSIRDILGFEPSEAVGQTALWFIENGNAEDYREHFGSHTDEDNVPMGPRVLFASNSFDRIINIDACDVQGIPFLLLVASEDVAKAGRFLDNIKTASTVLIEHLLLLADPLAELTNGEQREPKTVAVEIMAAGADSGAVMLCQLARQPLCSGICELSDGYMSLEDIISSDPETSDIADVWGRV